MDIEKMTGQGKSVMLAWARGYKLDYATTEQMKLFYGSQWKYRSYDIWRDPDGYWIPLGLPNLYDPANIAISYKVMQWVNELMANELDRQDDFDATINAFNDIHLPTKKWLAGWLDAVYMMVKDTDELAIEAGLVELEGAG